LFRSSGCYCLCASQRAENGSGWRPVFDPIHLNPHEATPGRARDLEMPHQTRTFCSRCIKEKNKRPLDVPAGYFRTGGQQQIIAGTPSADLPVQSADAGVKNGERGGGRPLLQCSKVGSTAAAGTSPVREGCRPDLTCRWCSFVPLFICVGMPRGENTTERAAKILSFPDRGTSHGKGCSIVLLKVVTHLIDSLLAGDLQRLPLLCLADEGQM